jgi:peptide/nickel transport system substrate-binding protein
MQRTSAHRRARIIAALTAFALAAAACGGDDDADSAAEPDEPSGDATAEPPAEEPATEEPAEEPAAEEPATEEPMDEGEPGGSVVFAAEQWPECLNPVTSCANASWLTWSVTAHILPRLMEIDTEGNYLASPVLTEAPSLENGMITQDPFTVTFRLRDDAVWSDGTPMTSEDIRFTWRAVMDTTGTLSTAGFDLITDVATPDDKTAVVMFEEDYAPWGDLFGGGTGFFLKADEFEGTDVADEMLDAIPWSGGPWVLQSWGGEEAILVRNETYWDTDRVPLLDQVTFVPREDTDTEIIALQTGEVSAIFPQPSPG